MRRHLHRFRLIFALSLMLPAIAAAPAAATFQGPVGPHVALSQPTPVPSTTLCSEVCDGAIARPPAAAHLSLPRASVVRTAEHGSGFAWGDAGIGAGVAFAVLALILGAAVTATTRRRVGQREAPVAG